MVANRQDGLFSTIVPLNTYTVYFLINKHNNCSLTSSLKWCIAIVSVVMVVIEAVVFAVNDCNNGVEDTVA